MNKKHLNYLLFIGILLFILGMTLISFMDTPMSYKDNAVMQMVSKIPGWSFFITVVLLSPLMEEFSFRSWILKGKWSKYLSLVLICGFTAATVGLIWGIVAAILLSVNLFLIPKLYKEKSSLKSLQTYIAVFLTSFFFALAHKDNLDLSHYLMAFPVYFGLALVLCYIGLRFHFVICILFHSCYNFILLTLGGFTFAMQEPVMLEGKTFKGELVNISGLKSSEAEKTKIYNTSKTEDSPSKIIFHRKLLTDIAKNIIKPDNLETESQVYKIEIYPETYRFYNITLEKQNTNISFDCKEIIQTMINKKLIKIDTIQNSKTIRIFDQ
ncbi:MAG: CPBP family intramembrane metalloprotease [Bacteroidales bacterium]|jgi:membrane protease YdiL (CAAX protease family)|nr:CPBP family intramembrane metalloprotease [Bacteroidales bacterium]